MKKELSPAVMGGVVAVVLIVVGVIFWMRLGRDQAGLPAEGQPGNQPPAIKGITPVNPSASRPR